METWWQVFSELDPKQYAEKRMGMIERSAEAQHYDDVGDAEATFGGAYDIPLRLVAGDEGLQEQVFRP